jgi:hypothetical protein
LRDNKIAEKDEEDEIKNKSGNQKEETKMEET